MVMWHFLRIQSLFEEYSWLKGDWDFVADLQSESRVFVPKFYDWFGISRTGGRMPLKV